MGEDVQPVLCISGVIAADSSPLPLVLIAGFFLEQIVNPICPVCCLEDGLVDAICVSWNSGCKPSDGCGNELFLSLAFHFPLVFSYFQ